MQGTLGWALLEVVVVVFAEPSTGRERLVSTVGSLTYPQVVYGARNTKVLPECTTRTHHSPRMFPVACHLHSIDHSVPFD